MLILLMQRLGLLLLTLSVSFFTVERAHAGALAEPVTFSSEKGRLDLLMIAKAAPVTRIPGNPTGWIYEICKLPKADATYCPGSDNSTNWYGGTLLKLHQGDLLIVRLVNQLPPVTDSDHAQEPGHAFLAQNPTNIHFHGMLVSPRSVSSNPPVFGDNVFVMTFNSKNGKAIPTSMNHGIIRYDVTDYTIPVPRSHPSGLFWFHPHLHGISLNQISAGMSGMITVGDPGDYFCSLASCSEDPSGVTVRHMLLKDTQILKSQVLQDEEDPTFCDEFAQPGEALRQGSCPGANLASDGDDDYTGGKWYFTINGQVYPTVNIDSRGGELWRIANASGSATYDLHLWDPQLERNMLFRVISIDGVSLSPSKVPPSEQALREIAGAKFSPEACPDTPVDGTNGVCTRSLHMMPSARAEVWVAYRDRDDRLSSAPRGSYAVFRTDGYQTGPSGDAWPRVDLARVEFGGAAVTEVPPGVTVNAEPGETLNAAAIAHDLEAINASMPISGPCPALAPGHMRRIFYAVPTTNMNAFGLAVEELDENGNVVGPKATDVTPYDAMNPTICIPLGPGNTPRVERWQLVNVATEDHNFHMHQSKFRVLSKDELSGSSTITGIQLDNLPLPHASGHCGNNPPDLSNPIEDWRKGLCHSEPITVEIPFAIAGTFVYHCHILEHEDGGMMAGITVLPWKAATASKVSGAH